MASNKIKLIPTLNTNHVFDIGCLFMKLLFLLINRDPGGADLTGKWVSCLDLSVQSSDVATGGTREVTPQEQG